MYNILVPVDFSPTSVHALEYALDLFASYPIKVTVLHAYKSYSGAFHVKSMDRVLGEEAEKQMVEVSTLPSIAR